MIQNVNLTTTKIDTAVKILSAPSVRLASIYTNGASSASTSISGMGLIQIANNSGNTLIRDWMINNSQMMMNSLAIINKTLSIDIQNITVMNSQAN